MARTLQEVLKDLEEAEKEYSEKCKKYGIEEKHRKKKVEVQLDENGNPIEPQLDENGNPIVNQEGEQTAEPVEQTVDAPNSEENTKIEG